MVTRMKPALLAAVVLLVFPSAAGGELKPTNLSPGGASASSPRIASDGVGNVVAAWREVNGDQSSIRATFREKGEAWGEVQQISAPAASTESPEVAMDRLGNAVGGRASDLLMGGYGRDILSGNSGNDTLRALDRGADAVFGGSGLDLYSLDRWLDRAQSIEPRL